MIVCCQQCCFFFVYNHFSCLSQFQLPLQPPNSYRIAKAAETFQRSKPQWVSTTSFSSDQPNLGGPDIFEARQPLIFKVKFHWDLSGWMSEIFWWNWWNWSLEAPAKYLYSTVTSHSENMYINGHLFDHPFVAPYRYLWLRRWANTRRQRLFAGNHNHLDAYLIKIAMHFCKRHFPLSCLLFIKTSQVNPCFHHGKVVGKWG